ncbi:MAG: outer membrane lipoprotein LolB [Gammaproteobacteria bacterium]|nr:outer membrane lipoprotein LolB [Gammaproteobacteria bacterium]
MKVTVVVFLLLLQGCASSQRTFVRNKVIESWNLKGKIAVVYPQGNCVGNSCRKKSDQGRINWKQIKEVYDIDVSDPFGRKVLNAKGGSSVLRILVPGKESLTLAPSDFLTLMVKDSSQRKILSGLSPVDLQYWVTGRPNPSEAFENGTDVFLQKGFKVSARQWRNTVIGKLPSLVVIKKNDLTVKIVAKEWSGIVK